MINEKNRWKKCLKIYKIQKNKLNTPPPMLFDRENIG